MELDEKLRQKDEEIENLKRQMSKVDRLEIQLTELFKQQKAFVFIPKPHMKEALTSIMGSEDKAQDVLKKLEKIKQAKKNRT